MRKGCKVYERGAAFLSKWYNKTLKGAFKCKIVFKELVPISEIKQVVLLIILTAQKRDRLGERGVGTRAGTPLDGLCGKAPPERGIFFRL